jgi:hypothetical protein
MKDEPEDEKATHTNFGSPKMRACGERTQSATLLSLVETKRSFSRVRGLGVSAGIEMVGPPSIRLR